jgi:hypothetical protein
MLHRRPSLETPRACGPVAMSKSHRLSLGIFPNWERLSIDVTWLRSLPVADALTVPARHVRLETNS